MIGKEVREIAELIGSKTVLGNRISGFAVDSRKVVPQGLFFAMKGEKVDGHDFLEEARDKGAIAAVVSKGFERKVEGLELIVVQDVLESLKKLARVKAAEENTRCIAITGSVGKTTTKEFLVTLLEGSFVLGKTPGNENSQVGLPLSILHEKKSDLFIAEMGMSQKGEIASLVSILPPEIAIVTQIALSHSLYFPGGLEEVAEAKAEIFSESATRKAFLHTQVSRFRPFKERLSSSFLYGEGGDAFIVPVKEGTYKIFLRGEETGEFSLPFTATHLVDNFLGAALAAKDLGMSWDEIFARAKLLKPYKMRFERVEKEGTVYINDSYNANPTSMKAALKNIPSPKPGGRVIAALGHMGELGHFSEDSHREVGRVASLHADLLYCIGEHTDLMADEFVSSGKKAFRFSCFEEFKTALREGVRQEDVVLIKASNSLKLWRVLED